MKAKDVETGGRYLAKVSGRVTIVVVLEEVVRTSVRGRTERHWRCRNEATGREVLVRSAQRFRGKATAAREER